MKLGFYWPSISEFKSEFYKGQTNTLWGIESRWELPTNCPKNMGNQLNETFIVHLARRIQFTKYVKTSLQAMSEKLHWTYQK